MEDNKTEQGKRKSEKCNEGIVENAERTGDMIIGRIYDKVFVPMSESSGSADEAMNERLILLIEGADIEHMTKTSLADLICKGAVIGQREGFISGVRFTARLFCNMLS
jgi:hypothetical protein